MINEWNCSYDSPFPSKIVLVHYELPIEVSLDNINECSLLKKVRANDSTFILIALYMYYGKHHSIIWNTNEKVVNMKTLSLKDTCVQFELLILLVSFSSLPNLKSPFNDINNHELDGKQLDALFVTIVFV